MKIKIQIQETFAWNPDNHILTVTGHQKENINYNK